MCRVIIQYIPPDGSQCHMADGRRKASRWMDSGQMSYVVSLSRARSAKHLHNAEPGQLLEAYAAHMQHMLASTACDSLCAGNKHSCAAEQHC